MWTKPGYDKGMSKVKRQSEVWGLCVIVLLHVQSSLTRPDIKAGGRWEEEEEKGGWERDWSLILADNHYDPANIDIN